MNSEVKVARDLEADLAICEAATPDPWVFEAGFLFPADESAEYIGYTPRAVDSVFIAEARTGWPYAIHQVLEAEKQVDRLRNELNILQEQLQNTGRCSD